MKLISLNTFGASQGQIFFEFIKEQEKLCDIFCFQEVFFASEPAPVISSNSRMYLFEELKKILVNYSSVFSEKSHGFDYNGKVNFSVKHGLAVFVRRGIEILSENTKLVSLGESKDINPIDGDTFVQVLDLSFNKNNFSLMNFHGPALPGTKLDTAERIKNSFTLKNIWESLPHSAKILCGDFNLFPETESIRILNSISKNLINEFNIKSTRNEISWQKYNNRQYFADYTFVSPELKVSAFEVPYNEVSDHLPMILEFEI